MKQVHQRKEERGGEHQVKILKLVKMVVGLMDQEKIGVASLSVEIVEDGGGIIGLVSHGAAGLSVEVI